MLRNILGLCALQKMREHKAKIDRQDHDRPFLLPAFCKFLVTGPAKGHHNLYRPKGTDVEPQRQAEAPQSVLLQTAKPGGRAGALNQAEDEVPSLHKSGRITIVLFCCQLSASFWSRGLQRGTTIYTDQKAQMSSPSDKLRLHNLCFSRPNLPCRCNLSSSVPKTSTHYLLVQGLLLRSENRYHHACGGMWLSTKKAALARM